MKRNYAKMTIALGLAVSLCAASGLSALAVYSPEENGPDGDPAIYNEAGAHMGLDEDTENAEVGDYSDEDYINAGAYIISTSPTTDVEYEPGIYYEDTSFSYGEDGMYIIIQDDDSTDKFYTMIKSTQDLPVGTRYIYTEDDTRGRLLDDKYTSTHMANTYEDSDYSYVSYDTSGGKLIAQEVELDEDGIPLDSQPEGTIYVYLVSETPADYYQRLANEEAGYEEKQNSEDRAYMPVNNHASTGVSTNNWANITEDDDSNYDDGIAKTGGTEGDSNTRLYAYSGQNVIVAKFAVSLEPSVAELTWSDSEDFDEDADYSITEGEIEIGVGESIPLYFHTQYTSTWGRDGYANSEISYEIGDDSIISYVGRAEEEGEESFVLTGLSEGTTTLTATVEDTDLYEGGAQVTLTVTVK